MSLDELVWRQFYERLQPTPDWEPVGRAPLEPHQTPPEGDWKLWILEGGRGGGKTEGSSRYYSRFMRANPGARGRIIAPTFGDAVESCIKGPSGLVSMDPDITWHATDPGGAKVRWPNGSEALVFGTPTPREVERFRAGGNRHIDWWEEIAANPMIRTSSTMDNAWDQAQMGLRLGDHPHSIASTTPRPSKKYREIRKLPGTVITHGTMEDNPHTSKEWRESMKEIYGGTRLGRQEILGELLEDVEGALWTADLIERYRIQPHLLPQDLIKVVVPVDPPGGRTECGIVVMALDPRGHAFVISDATAENRPSPATWSRKAVRNYHDHKADAVLGERNYGGEMVEHTIRTVPAERGYPSGNDVRYRDVNATRGKAVRAEPCVGLYEQGKVHHVGIFPKLEDELTQWVPGETPESPNRLDALVWGLYDLIISARKAPTMGRVADARRSTRGR